MAATDAERQESYVEITHRVAEEAWGKGDFDVIHETFADDFVCHTTAAPEDVEGPAAYQALIETFRSGMSDLSVEVVDTLVDGDTVAIRFRTQGTHDGELMGLEPTGKRVEGGGAAIARFEDGTPVEVWEFGDQAGMLRQLGVLELPEAAP